MTEIRREFEPTPVAPALARQALDGWLSDMVGQETADNARAVATELIANAVRHGGLREADQIVLLGAIDSVRDRVRIEIEQPTPLSGAFVDLTDNPHGYGIGLRIVDGMATEWGLVEGPPGVVWFEVDR
jgi:anti-sigma regulatory factor (Ser/Thr protein kinase)